MLHKFPSEVDEMPYEDAILVLAHCELENERIEAERNKHSGKQVQTSKLKKPKRK